ncbi:MAG: DUF4293 family protein [Prevotella sp.]|nr:DUF4293 family protein [Prevotella sp.]
MIQRKQTVFLLLAAIVAAVCAVLRWQLVDIAGGLSAILSIYTIFIYKQRPRQAKLCLAGLFVIFVWYILLAVYQGYVTTIDSMPMVSAILVFMARKGIIDDEKLVRAADRIR